jgi:hypothetical protein
MDSFVNVKQLPIPSSKEVVARQERVGLLKCDITELGKIQIARSYVIDTAVSELAVQSEGGNKPIKSLSEMETIPVDVLVRVGANIRATTGVSACDSWVEIKSPISRSPAASLKFCSSIETFASDSGEVNRKLVSSICGSNFTETPAAPNCTQEIL